MISKERLGVIGGNGWLGSALIRAAVATGMLEAGQITVSSRSGSRGTIADIPVNWTRDNAELVRHSDVVILSVRPGQFAEVDVDLSGKLAISVMAGVSCAEVARKTGARRIVRTMPNAAAAIGKSFTPWFAASELNEADQSFVETFFAASGEAARVSEEEHVDYCVALTGSGAALPALLAEALIADATARGLSRDFAVRAAKSVLCDASQIFHDPGADTAAVVSEMIDYDGTTAAALKAMIDRGFAQTVAAGLEAAFAKALRIAAKA